MELQRRKMAVCVLLILTGILSLAGVLEYRSASVKTWSESPGSSGNQDEDTILDIYTVEDYLKFASSVKNGNRYEGLYVNLYSDLDFSGVTEGLTAGNEENTQCRFCGIFDGNGHHMKNLIMESEKEAGLFRDLEGTVCNLDIESGQISAELGGAVASSVEMGGCVLNCASRADVNGNTVDGLVGRSRGKIQNCSGPYDGMTASQMNQGLCSFDSSLSVDHWYCWKEQEGKPSLSEKTANTLVSMNVDYRMNMEKTTLEGYYSQRDGMWCFALPGNDQDTDLTVRLCFSDGKELELQRKAGCPQISCQTDTGLYKIAFLRAGSAPSLMLNLPEENALRYLHADRENRLQGTFTLLDTKGAVCAEGKVDKVKGHGHDSWRAPKKSYNLRFHEAQDLLGMGAGENYVLLAAYQENSLLAYKVTNDLSSAVGMAYAPKSRFVHLYVSGRYLGMYLLTGKIEIGDSRFQLKNLAEETQRLNRRELENYERRDWHSAESPAQRTWFELPRIPQDVTGGYIVELATVDYDRERSNFVSDRDFSFMLRSMPFASEEQVNYIADYWQDFENALYSEDGYNDKGKYYTEYIDMESFADQWLFYELNQETSVNDSVYFYKDSDQRGDGLLHASWPWDMENSLIRSRSAAESWFAGTPEKTHGYWMQLYRHKDFAETVYREWTEKFVPALETALQEETVEDPDGLSSLNWYLEQYREDGWMDNSLWPGSVYSEKLERIRRIFTVRKDFMTRVLALYQEGYDSFYEEEGVLYGVLESGEAAAIGPGDL